MSFVITIIATAGNSFRFPLVAVPKVSLYQLVFFVLFLHAPPSESFRVSYTNISVAVSRTSDFIFDILPGSTESKTRLFVS